MPGSASAGTALGVPKNPTSNDYNLPKIGDHIQRKVPHKTLKDPLMREFGKDFCPWELEVPKMMGAGHHRSHPDHRVVVGSWIRPYSGN
jgi:hypothetical protein